MKYEKFEQIEQHYKNSDNADIQELIKHIKGLHELLGHYVRTLEQIYLKSGEAIGYDATELKKSTLEDELRPRARYD